MRPTTQGPTGSTEYPGALAGRWRLAIGSGLASGAADCSAAKHLWHTSGDGRTDRADGMLISSLTGRLSNTGSVGIAEMMATPGRCCAWSAADGPGRSHQDARIASSDRVRQYSDRTMWSSYCSQQHTAVQRRLSPVDGSTAARSRKRHPHDQRSGVHRPTSSSCQRRAASNCVNAK